MRTVAAGIISALTLTLAAFAPAACGSEPQDAAEPPAAAAERGQVQQQTVQQSAPQSAAQDGAAQQTAPARESAEDAADRPNSAEAQNSSGQQAAPAAQEQQQAAPTLSAAAQEAAGWSEEELQRRAEAIAAAGSVSDLVGINAWLNGAETTIARELAKGNIVLIDFWTYTCVNCIRTLPFLTEWHAKYGDRGLTIIGVHTPEFEFEKDRANVSEAIEQYGIEYLVAQDNDFRTWRAFNNRFWPAKYLIGPVMGIRYQHFGEGDYLETEQAIRRALADAGWDLSGVAEGSTAAAPQRDPVARGQTRELYGGTHRNYGSVQYAAQPEYYLQAGAAQLYTDIEAGQRQPHKWYLQGLWRNDPEAIVHARRTENLEDYLAFAFTARTVNVVLTVAADEAPFNVYLELDGRWLRPDEAGADVLFDGEERSFVRVTRNDLYRLVELPVWSTHELKLRSNSDQLAIFAFTFGSYLGGE